MGQMGQRGDGDCGPTKHPPLRQSQLLRAALLLPPPPFSMAKRLSVGLQLPNQHCVRTWQGGVGALTVPLRGRGTGEAGRMKGTGFNREKV